MTAVSLAFLVACIFGAFAYGSSTVMALRQASPVWAIGHPAPGLARVAVDRVSLAMFALCTVWFVLNALSELRRLGGHPREGYLDLLVLVLAFAFPPIVMHVVWRETPCGGSALPGPWGWPVAAMYGLSPIACAGVVAAIFGWVPRPEPFGVFIGGTFGVLFTVTSLYAATLTLRARRNKGAAGRRGDSAMLILYGSLVGLFLALTLVSERSLLMPVVDRVSRSTPILFLVTAIYFENRFEFYDLVIKRAVLLVVTLVLLGTAFTLVAPFIETLPAGPVRPWLAAMVLVPAVMLMPWGYGKLSAGLDRLWFGRTFTAVDAVKHVLGAMQTASSEAALTDETESRLAAIFGTPIAVRVDDAPGPPGPVLDVEAFTPSGGRVRFVPVRTPGARLLLSEDIAMLRSLAGVFGFMLETLRLQQKRQEQELVAHDLRLQTSRSALTALRAQINPHFLFNALNAIASLIHSNPERADAAVEQLAEVFRYTLRRSDSDWAPLDQEIAFARAYLDVEQARFGDRLTCTIDADHASPAPPIPSMLLQTLIENAVKHGVSQTRGHGRIEVMVRTANETVIVEVRDNGPGPAPAGALPAARRRDGEGFGLRSVRERLAGHFGDRATLTLTRDAAAGITIARMTLPLARVTA